MDTDFEYSGMLGLARSLPAMLGEQAFKVLIVFLLFPMGSILQKLQVAFYIESHDEIRRALASKYQFLHLDFLLCEWYSPV